MPFRSKAQMRYFFAAERRGELPKGTARRWARETPNLKSLPERVSTKKKKKGFISGCVSAAGITIQDQDATRAINRVFTGLLLGGLESLFRQLIDCHYWNYSEKSLPASKMAQNTTGLIWKDASSDAILAPMYGLLWGWLQYGSTLAPVPKRPAKNRI